MPLLKRKIPETSFIISIESGIEDIQENELATRHEDCDFLVNFITGEEPLSARFCCKLFYTLFRLCFVGESGISGWMETAKKRPTFQTI